MTSGVMELAYDHAYYFTARIRITYLEKATGDLGAKYENLYAAVEFLKQSLAFTQLLGNL